jgi:selenide,water dikinase
MACRGCAAKLAAGPLLAALSRLEVTGGAVDAAVVGRDADGGWLLQSVDGFPALVDDPWLNGRLTTIHACSDLWASGAAVESVQALLTLPEAAPELQEELLVQSLAGVRSVLDPLGAPLLGGHTMEGRDGAGLALALTVNGRVPAVRPTPTQPPSTTATGTWAAVHAAPGPWPKGPLLPGDVLILSRPIGSGVLFAAAMAGAARPEWIDLALETMQQSQAPLVELLAAHGCHACTDVTGFGLLGHLGEMLGQPPGDGGISVELGGAAIPSFPGVIQLLEKGHASTLAPSNSTALALLGDGVDLVLGPTDPHTGHGPGPGAMAAASPSGTGAGRDRGPGWQTVHGLLIDPQTCGPLLAAVPAERSAGALLAMRSAGFPAAAVIGVVR